ncbi:MAG TPA: N-acetylmuramoyl-L-alanine amidase [Gemmatimonadaceae bacterium]|nr:N-acetylmuramoyl-L-alanine amidase [Gemmatimonadaceae bacterium]
MPLATGPVAINVVYPPPNAVISIAGDSTFIFGSIGNGNARLTINGSEVQVLPNGSFLAYIPVPRESSRYVLEASLDGRTERLEHAVRITPRSTPIANEGPLVADAQSLRPAVSGRWAARETMTVSVRANANAAVHIALAEGRRVPLTAARETLRDSTLWQRSVQVEDLQGGARLVVTRGADSVALPVPAQHLLDSLGAAPRVVRLTATSALPDTDQVVIARPVPNGTYKWLLLPGTIVQVTGRVGTQARVRLDSQLEAWIDSAAVTELVDAVVPRRVVGNPRVTPSDTDWADVVLPMAAPAPYLIDHGPDALVVTLYGTTLDIDIAALRADTSVVRNITWTQIASDRGQITLHLAHAPYGYLVRWQPGGMVVRVRRPPRVTAGRPLAGLTIAVDPGHPPVGATGPTGLYEGDAVLPIAERLRDELERRGARVVLTRTTRDPVALADRPVIARRANAHAFVSIHLNALPDGVNPFSAHGTGTYFFHPQSLELAREVQAGMVREMRLRDHGVFYDNLAVVRQTWMPSVLCEGAFLMIPEQEALLRTTEFQQAYARGVAEGLEAYFGALARRD